MSIATGPAQATVGRQAANANIVDAGALDIAVAPGLVLPSASISAGGQLLDKFAYALGVDAEVALADARQRAHVDAAAASRGREVGRGGPAHDLDAGAEVPPAPATTETGKQLARAAGQGEAQARPCERNRYARAPVAACHRCCCVCHVIPFIASWRKTISLSFMPSIRNSARLSFRHCNTSSSGNCCHCGKAQAARFLLQLPLPLSLKLSPSTGRNSHAYPPAPRRDRNNGFPATCIRSPT